MKKFIIFDTETTGLPNPPNSPLESQPRIIEFGYILTNGSEILKSFNQLIDPEVELPEIITKITGIKPEDLVGQKKFPDIIEEVREDWNGCDYLVAHNAEFDTTLLGFELARMGKPDYINPMPEVICTVSEYYPLFGYRPKLVNLYEHFMGKPLPQTHRAIDDVMALHETLVAAKFYESLAS